MEKFLLERGFYMKSTGVVRKVDELGRIVLPAEIRQCLEIQVKDPLEFFVDGERIILKKYQPGCIFCGSMENVTTFEGKNLCAACIRKLKAL